MKKKIIHFIKWKWNGFDESTVYLSEWTHINDTCNEGPCDPLLYSIYNNATITGASSGLLLLMDLDWLNV